MRLKSSLITSYLVVLLLPIICGGIIYTLDKRYKARMQDEKYIEESIMFATYERLVNQPSYYIEQQVSKDLQELVNHKEVVIILYNPQGHILFSTQGNGDMPISQVKLYQHLNEIQRINNKAILKKPVFNRAGEIIGIYEIHLLKRAWEQILHNHLYNSLFILLIILILSYYFIIRYLDKRFNKPIKQVIQGMNSYAQGNTGVYVNYKFNDEIGELCKHFNTMKNQIEESRRAVEEGHRAKEYMIATMSHDLKTPLTTIRAYAEIIELEDNLEDAKRKDYLTTILNKCDYMKDMLDDLSTYNLLTMNYELSLVEVEGEEFCEMLFSGLEVTCREKSLTLERDIKVSGIYKVDVKYMIRVIDNIMSNAICYTPSGGHIWVGAFSTGMDMPPWLDKCCQEAIEKYPKPGVALIIKNEGKSISDEDKGNLFKPFYQGDEARSKKEHKGVGLGLSISKMIMEKHEGFIEMIPIKGVGNAILCYLKVQEIKVK